MKYDIETPNNVRCDDSLDTAEIEPQFSYSGGNKRRIPHRKLLWGASGFLLINVIVLYIVHFSHDHDHDFIKTTSSDNERLQGVDPMTAVSFESDGTLSSGAGTTLYRSRVNFPEGELSHVFLEPLNAGEFSKKHLMAYRQDAQKTVFSTVGSDGTLVQQDSVEAVKPLGLISLTQTTAVALTLADAAPYAAYLSPLSIKDDKVDLIDENKVQVSKRSLASRAGKVADDAVAVAYYDYVNNDKEEFEVADWGADRLHKVRIAKVDGEKIELTEGVQFGGISSSSQSTELASPVMLEKEDAFFVPWYSRSFSNETVDSGLCLSLFQFNRRGNKVDQLDESCDTAVQPDYFTASIHLSGNSGVIAFYDKLNNHAFTLALVEAQNDKIQIVSKHVVNTGTGPFDFGQGWSWFPEPKMEKMSSTRFAVSYMHTTNAGQPQSDVFDVSSQSSFHKVTSTIPLSSGEYSVAAEKSSTNPLTMDIVALSSSEFAVSYLAKVGSDAVQEYSIVGVKSSPSGIVISDNNDDDADIAWAGLVSSPKNLERGKTYFATSNGDLLPRAVDQGKRLGSNWIHLGSNIYVLPNARMGIAVEEDKLMLTHMSN